MVKQESDTELSRGLEWSTLVPPLTFILRRRLAKSPITSLSYPDYNYLSPKPQGYLPGAPAPQVSLTQWVRTGRLLPSSGMQDDVYPGGEQVSAQREDDVLPPRAFHADPGGTLVPPLTFILRRCLAKSPITSLS